MSDNNIQLDSPWILMNPGPINLSDRVRLALLQPDLCHREVEFQNLLESVRSKLLKIFDPTGRYNVALVAGSGTAAVEAMIVSCVGEKGALLSIENGVYGERISAIARAAGIEVIAYHLDWGEPVDLKHLESLLADKNISAVSCIHHETTTGLLNPIEAIGQLVDKAGKKFFVDTVSGLGAEELDLNKACVTAAACTANKAIHGVPGVSFVMIDRAYLEEMQSFRVRSIYFDLRNYIKCQDAGTIPFTMPVHVMYAFLAALEELEEETVEGRIARFKNRSKTVRDALRSDYSFYLPEEHYSNTMSSWHLPENKTYEQMHDFLKEHSIIIYAGQGGLAKSIFRVAHLGEYNDAEVLPKLIELLKQFKA